MARPQKQGLEYFPFDVDFFNDEKISAISGEFGLKGEMITIKLLCTIYRNGYFTMWNELTKMNLLKILPGVSIELLEQVVNRLVKWGFFNEALFNSDMVLTSNGIQKRYIEATKRRKDAPPLSYCIHYVYNNPVKEELMYTLTPKVKESKVNKSKVNDTAAPSEKLDDWEKEIFRQFKTVTMGFDDDYLIAQVKMLRNKYPQIIARQAAGLVNTWASRLSQEDCQNWKQRQEPPKPKEQKVFLTELNPELKQW